MPRDWHNKRRTKSVRDYSRRKYGNPLFPQRNSRSRRKKFSFAALRRWLILIGVAFVLITTLWYVFWSQSFKLSDIDVAGATADTETAIREIIDEHLSTRAFLIFPRSSIFFVNEDKLRKGVDEYVFLEKLDIRTRMPNGIIISVQEKQVASVVSIGARFLALDKDGNVIRELTARETYTISDLPEDLNAVSTSELGTESVAVAEIEPKNEEAILKEKKVNKNPYPLVLLDDDMRHEDAIPGESIIPTEILSLALQAYARLPDITDSGVRWFVFDERAESIEAVLRSGWSVYLSVDIPFDIQGERLSLVLKEKVEQRREELEYVDLRYDERIFFRFREIIPAEETPEPAVTPVE